MVNVVSLGSLYAERRLKPETVKLRGIIKQVPIVILVTVELATTLFPRKTMG